MIYLHARSRSLLAVVMPFYTLLLTLILVPLGVVSYVHMSLAHRNWGLIRPGRIEPSM